MKLQYTDTDGDKITITTELEWTAMKQDLQDQAIYRVNVVDGDGNYFKDGPKPELVTVYSEMGNVPQPESQWPDLQQRVTKALENLFAGGKILPLNLPTFLQDILKIKVRDDNTVDLDVDINAFSNALHRRAYDLLGNPTRAEILEAKSYLLSQLILEPSNAIASYNLACAYSLLEQEQAALDALRKSIELGYHDTEHMSTDPDLKRLQGLPEFQKLLVLATEVPEVELPPPIVVPEVKEPILVPEVKEPIVVPEVKEAEPEPEPVVEVRPEFQRWETELKVLGDMGFLNQSILVQTLDKTGGSVEQALMDLLG